MLREELETSLQQALELFVLGGGDQRLFERPIDGLMEGHLVLGVSHIEGRPAQLRQLFPLFGRRSGQGFAGAVILWLYLQLIEQREGLLVYRFVIPDHLLREGFDSLVLTLAQRLLGGSNVALPRRIGDMGNLRIGWLPRALSNGARAGKA